MNKNTRNLYTINVVTMNIKNLAELKRYLATPNACIELIAVEGNPNHKFLNVKRKVEKLQSNAVKLEGGSWLNLYKASDFIFYQDNTFGVISANLVYKYY